MHLCEHIVKEGSIAFGGSIRCVAIAIEGRSKCTVHAAHPEFRTKPAKSWAAGQPFPVYWKDAEPRRAFDTPWEA